MACKRCYDMGTVKASEAGSVALCPECRTECDGSGRITFYESGNHAPYIDCPGCRACEDEPSNVREAALCLLAADALLADDARTAEAALSWTRRLEQALDEEPWADGKHSGDCTKTAHTCTRCVIEELEGEARARWEGD
jgi:hypothetical protein